LQGFLVTWIHIHTHNPKLQGFLVTWGITFWLEVCFYDCWTWSLWVKVTVQGAYTYGCVMDESFWTSYYDPWHLGIHLTQLALPFSSL
jgi:hypothetical protein